MTTDYDTDYDVMLNQYENELFDAASKRDIDATVTAAIAYRDLLDRCRSADDAVSRDIRAIVDEQVAASGVADWDAAAAIAGQFRPDLAFGEIAGTLGDVADASEAIRIDKLEKNVRDVRSIVDDIKLKLWLDDD